MPRQDEHVFLYRVGEPHVHVDGYPKPVKEELGLDGPIDAAFMCNNQTTAHIVKGKDAKAVISSISLILKEMIVPSVHGQHSR